MLRRALLAVPLVAVGLVLLGMWLRTWPTVAIVVALVLAVGLQTVFVVAQERRIAQVADRVSELPRGGSRVELDPSGSPEWRRLVSGLEAVDESLRERFDELAGERARVERLLGQLPVAVLLFADTGLVFANPKAVETFRLDDEAVGRTPRQVLAVAALADAVIEVRETGRDVEVEVDVHSRTLLARAAETSDGEVAMVVSDITERRRVAAIRRDFVTNASHELKTPVAGIRALADSLLMAIDRDPERARQMIERLQTEAARLAQLVRELLDLARLEEAAAQRGGRVDVADVVRTQLARFEVVAREREIEISCRCDAPASVVGIPEDIRLVVANLLENAVQYTPNGGQVAVRVERSGGRVVLEVADTGIGISEAERDRVFERFYRVDKARSRAAGGTGLGLAIVRHAVQRHGGEIALESTLGQGSTFRVQLPVEGESSDGWQ